MSDPVGHWLERLKNSCGGALLLLCIVGSFGPSLGIERSNLRDGIAVGIGFLLTLWLSRQTRQGDRATRALESSSARGESKP